jgi:hypothetical protein
MVMVLPFILALVAAAVAWSGRAKAALLVGLVTIGVQVLWLLYHARSTLTISL